VLIAEHVHDRDSEVAGEPGAHDRHEADAKEPDSGDQRDDLARGEVPVSFADDLGPAVLLDGFMVSAHDLSLGGQTNSSRRPFPKSIAPNPPGRIAVLRPG
jgi:hypothetical protein